MDVADAIDLARQLQMKGQPDEALEHLLAAAKEHSDEDLDSEIAFFYAERGWTRTGNEERLTSCPRRPESWTLAASTAGAQHDQDQ